MHAVSDFRPKVLKNMVVVAQFVAEAAMLVADRKVTFDFGAVGESTIFSDAKAATVKPDGFRRFTPITCN
jgi:hypothetical protein